MRHFPSMPASAADPCLTAWYDMLRLCGRRAMEQAFFSNILLSFFLSSKKNFFFFKKKVILFYYYYHYYYYWYIPMCM